MLKLGNTFITHFTINNVNTYVDTFKHKYI